MKPKQFYENQFKLALPPPWPEDNLAYLLACSTSKSHYPSDQHLLKGLASLEKQVAHRIELCLDVTPHQSELDEARLILGK